MSIPTLTLKPKTADAQQNQACCSWTFCCGLKGSWRDAVMFGMEGGTGTIAVITGIFFNTYLGIGLAVVTAGEVVVHGLWRRDAAIADLHQVVVDVEHSETQVADTTKKTDKIATKLVIEDDKLEAEKVKLRKAAKEWEDSREMFAEQVTKLEKANGILTDENKNFSLENQKLKAQISQLQKIVLAIRDHLSVFNQQNTEFKTNVGKLSKEVTTFGNEDETLKKAIGDVDKELGQEISGLAEQVALAQRTSHDVFTLLAQENQKLQTEIKSLQTTVEAINTDDEKIAQKIQQLKELEEKNAKANEAMIQMDHEFRKLSSALMEAKKDREAEQGKIEEMNKKFIQSTDNMTQITKRLSVIALDIGDLERKFDAANTSDLNKQKEDTEKKQQEIDAL